MWNCPCCEFRRFLCIDTHGRARMDKESGEVRGPSAEKTVIQDTVRAASYA